MEYDIVTAGTPVQLTARIRSAISLGWEPQGGPFLNEDGREWCQAIVKRAPQKLGDLQIREPRRK